MRRLVVCFVLLIVTTPAFAQADWRQKVDPALLADAAAKASTDTLTFLVRLAGQPDLSAAASLPTKEAKGRYVFEQLTAAAARAQAPVVAALQAGGAHVRPFWIANVLHVRGRRADVERAARRAEVTRVFRDEPFRQAPTQPGIDGLGKADDAAAVRAAEWNIARVNAPAVWALGVTGEGVVVAGQDTGYDWDHPALKAQYRGWDGATADHAYNWHDAVHQIDANNAGPNPCGLDSPVPCDDGTHGTHTMGTMVGRDGANEIGMAPGAAWIGCRNMERGWGLFSNYLECFQFFLAPTDLQGDNPDPSQAPHVINNSWYCPEEEGCNPTNFGEMETAIEHLRAAGVVVVVSAGNSGPTCSTVNEGPGSIPPKLTVGATHTPDVGATMSSRPPGAGIVERTTSSTRVPASAATSPPPSTTRGGRPV